MFQLVAIDYLLKILNFLWIYLNINRAWIAASFTLTIIGGRHQPATNRTLSLAKLRAATSRTGANLACGQFTSSRLGVHTTISTFKPVSTIVYHFIKSQFTRHLGEGWLLPLVRVQMLDENIKQGHDYINRGWFDPCEQLWWSNVITIWFSNFDSIFITFWIVQTMNQ